MSLCVVWQADGWTPLYAASHNGHVEVVRALVEAGAAVNQAAVREDLGGCWCSGVRGWLVFGIAACACSFVCVMCVFVFAGCAWRLRDAMLMRRMESCRRCSC